MIKLYLEENPEWTDRANDSMSMLTFFDELYLVKLTTSITAESFEYKKLYDQNKEFINGLIEMFFPALLFIPRQISENDSMEFLLFEVLTAIIKIEKYYELESRKKDGWRKEHDRYKKALCLIKKYSDITINYDGFPNHKNKILFDLNLYFESIKKEYLGKKIQQYIKKHYQINKITSTKEIAKTKEISKYFDGVEDDYLEERTFDGVTYKYRKYR